MTDLQNGGNDIAQRYSVVETAEIGFDAPIRDVLQRLGYLTEEQASKVAEYKLLNNLEFDQAALVMGFITNDDLDRARELLINSLALQNVNRRPVSDELIVVNESATVRAEAIRLLRTQVISQHVKLGRRGLVMVAPVDSVGCTYLTANLAVALSQVGIKVLLIDTNMRSPRVDQIFGLDPNATGLSSYLTLQATRIERVINPNVLPNLSVIAAGPPVPRPQELLSSARFRDGANTVMREYDLVMFDTAAANTSADALAVGGTIGYALLVARRNQTYFKDVSTLVAQLAASRCAVIGSVLNEF